MRKENNSGKLNKVKLIGTIIIFVAIIFFIVNCINIMQLPANEFVVENDSVSFEGTADGVFIRKEIIVLHGYHFIQEKIIVLNLL